MIAEVSSALCEPVRLEILQMIGEGRGDACSSPDNPDVPQGICSCDILPAFPKMGQSKLAYHMKILRDADLVCDKKQGKWVYYTLNEKRLQEYMERIADRYLAEAPLSGQRMSPKGV